MATLIKADTKPNMMLSVYKNLLLNPPFATQKINITVDKRAVESIIIIISTRVNYLLIISKGKRKISERKGRGSLLLKIANFFLEK